MLLSLYRVATHLGGPMIGRHVRRRAQLGKEETTRLDERFGRPSLRRPDGPLLWFHGASVGEAQAALPLITALLGRRDRLHVLLTTGTVSSARLMATRLPRRAIHQFVPIDRARHWQRFLDFWRPDAGLLVESEIWPNLIVEAERRALPLIIVNGRMSPRSFRNWRWARRTAARLFSSLELCLARSDEDAARFRALGAKEVRSLGDLKHAAPLLSVDDDHLKAWRTTLGDRLVWLAASTHPGEEVLIQQAHQILKADFPGLLTMLVPRHPERADELAVRIEAAGLAVARRSRRAMPTLETDIYLGDSLGELGLFYRLTPIALIGGSLVPLGGHNPFEAARLDCALLAGPHTDNFNDMMQRLEQQGAMRRVADLDDLVITLRQLFRDAQLRQRMIEGARAVSEEEGLLLDPHIAALLPFLDRPRADAPMRTIETVNAGP